MNWQGWGGGAVLTALILLVGHWFPWRGLLGRELRRIECYVYGVLAIWLGFAVWRGLAGDWRTPAGLMLLAIVAGAAVIGAYGIDGIAQSMQKARKGDEVFENGHTD